MMHWVLIKAQQKYLDVERVDISVGLISAPRPLSLGCPSSPVGPPESLRVLQHLDVPLLGSLQPQRGLLSSLGFLLLLLPEVAVVGTCQVCGYSPFLLFVHQADVQRVHLFVSLHQGCPTGSQSVQPSKTGPAISVTISAT